MTALSESDSSKTLPARINATTDGASLGDSDTARSWPTTSSGGTNTVRTAMRPSQPRMIGTANRRIHLAKPVFGGCSSGTTPRRCGTSV